VSWWDPTGGRIGTRHVQVFIPSVDRNGDPIPGSQQAWVEECLAVLGELFGGATAFPPSRGVWRAPDGNLVYDDTVIVFSYVDEADLIGSAGESLRDFLMRLGRETNQGEVGVFIDGTYYGIRQFENDMTQQEARHDER
jgi:hypothetical protein